MELGEHDERISDGPEQGDGEMTSLLSFLIAGVLLGGLYGLLALPLTLVWRSTGLFDFAAGAYVVVAGLVAADVGGIAGALAGIGVAVALTMVSAGIYLAFKLFQSEAEPLTVGLATFGVAIAATAGAQVWLGTEPRFMHVLSGSWDIGGVLVSKARLTAFVIAVVLVIAVVFFLSRTTMGLKMRAAATSPHSAELLGVPVRRIEIGAFAVSGVLYGVVGVLAVSTLGLVYSSTVTFSILALSAAVIIGLKGPGTAMFGGILLGVFESLSRGYVNDLIAGILPSLLIIVALVGASTLRSTSMAARP